jgi:hypothetical protein
MVTVSSSPEPVCHSRKPEGDACSASISAGDSCCEPMVDGFHEVSTIPWASTVDRPPDLPPSPASRSWNCWPDSSRGTATRTAHGCDAVDPAAPVPTGTA